MWITAITLNELKLLTGAGLDLRHLGENQLKHRLSFISFPSSLPKLFARKDDPPEISQAYWPENVRSE